MCALLADECVFVHPLARDAVTLCDDFGRIDHLDIGLRVFLDDVHIGRDAHFRRLHHRDAVHAATDDNIHFAGHDLARGNADRDHARRTLTVYTHRRNFDREVGRQHRVPPDGNRYALL